MTAFSPGRSHYRATATPPSAVVSVAEIEPIRRAHECDAGGFYRDRLVSVLKGFVSDIELPPIEIHELPSGVFRYGLRGGFHRYFASIAAGFTEIPAVVLPYYVP